VTPEKTIEAVKIDELKFSMLIDSALSLRRNFRAGTR
jgi:hypothetical protein